MVKKKCTVNLTNDCLIGFISNVELHGIYRRIYWPLVMFYKVDNAIDHYKKNMELLIMWRKVRGKMRDK